MIAIQESCFFEKTLPSKEAERLTQEKIFLNNTLIQKTHQEWTASGRTLEVEGHKRLYRYQNGELIGLSSNKVELNYTYDTAGLLAEKRTPLSHRKTSYNRSGLPEFVDSPIGDERLLWDRSGKPSLYKSRKEEKSFPYTPRGYLQSAGNLDYTFDFGGKGVRTESPTHSVESLDELGRVYSEEIRNTSVKVYYDEAGQVTSQNGKDFTWDVWGRLVKVEESGTTFQISYDGFGRRIQTIYTPYSGSSQTSYHFYDPEEEFGEIGTKTSSGTFWRFDGPDGCDAVVDDDKTLYLNNDALGHSYNIPFSPYGPTKTAPIHNLISYAQMLSWHSRSMNPIGLIWMGARYYDPETGRFLSPDPVGLPLNIDLYSYANGDPINFVDPDGRFASQAYQQLKASTLSTFSNPRVQGGLRAFASSAEITAGTALTFSSAGWAAPVGGAIIAHGMDNFVAGTHQMFSGQQRSTATELLLQKTGMSAQKASLANDWMSFVGTLGRSVVATKIHSNSIGARGFTKPSTASFERAQIGKNFKPFTQSNFRYNLTQLTGTNPGKGFQAHHVFPQRFRRDFSSKGINIHDPKYGTWRETTSHQVNARQYNLEWDKFLYDNFFPTKGQILRKGEQMISDHGMKINY